MSERDISAQVAAFAEYMASPVRAAPALLPPAMLQAVATTAAAHREALDQAERSGALARPTGLLDIAVSALERAAAMLAPTDALGDGTPGMRPVDVAALVERLGQVGDALGGVIEQLQQQLARMHLDALHGRVVGPPGSTASAEVERLIRDVIDTAAAAAAIGSSSTLAVARALRLNHRGNPVS